MASCRCIYIATTDTGLEGIGEYHDREPNETVAKYIDTNPFDWVGDQTSLPLGMAMCACHTCSPVENLSAAPC
eukprot:SAG11_NODE_6612_length_1279_cov_1.161864_2_plen_73_part_00